MVPSLCLLFDSCLGERSEESQDAGCVIIDGRAHFISPLRKRSVLLSLPLFVLFSQKRNRLGTGFPGGFPGGDGGESNYSMVRFWGASHLW